MTQNELIVVAVASFAMFVFTQWVWRWTRHNFVIAFVSAVLLGLIVSYLIMLDTAKVAACGKDYPCGLRYVAEHFAGGMLK